jgi:hypothetical protein
MATHPFCSVRIQYSGSPGSLQAQVSSVESKGNLVVDSHIQNEGNGWAGSGANPWHLDEDTESILFLTNESDQPARIGAQVAANGVTYYLTKLRLNPHETRAIDIRKLRDAQEPDLKGNRIPAAATDGSVIWVRGDNLPVMGRLMLIHRHEGMASNYDCCICSCPFSYVPNSDYVKPASSHLVVNGTVGLTFYAGYLDCNNIPWYYNESGAADWSPGDPNIATVDSSGTVTGRSAGTTSVGGEYYDYSYYYNPLDPPYCFGTLYYGSASAAVGVYTPTYAVLTGSGPAQNLCGTGKQRTYAAYDDGYHLLPMTLDWTLHENANPTCGMTTDGSESEPTFTDIIINCQANCTFKSTQWFSVVYKGYTYTLQAQDGVDPTFRKYPAHTGWQVTATTKIVTVTDF